MPMMTMAAFHSHYVQMVAKDELNPRAASNTKIASNAKIPSPPTEPRPRNLPVRPKHISPPYTYSHGLVNASAYAIRHKKNWAAHDIEVATILEERDEIPAVLRQLSGLSTGNHEDDAYRACRLESIGGRTMATPPIAGAIQLGGDTEERYAFCFPKNTLEPTLECTWCDFMLADHHVSCGVMLKDHKKDAYISRLGAWPQNMGHGVRFVEKLKLALADMGVERVWLFTDFDCDPRVRAFYEDKCDFKRVDEEDMSVWPPTWIVEMWNDDTLFVCEL